MEEMKISFYSHMDEKNESDSDLDQRRGDKAKVRSAFVPAHIREERNLFQARQYQIFDQMSDIRVSN